jgi:hypothetical protein
VYDWTDFEYTRFGRFAHRFAPVLAGESSEGEGRITPRLWHFTHFDSGAPFDEEIQSLIVLEEGIGQIPAWAIDVAIQIDSLPHCGQISFPDPIYAICRGIGQEKPDPGFLFCFEASSETKARVEEYVEILESWCGRQTQSTVASRWADRRALVDKVYGSLGGPTPLKLLLVERVMLQCRFWMDALITNDGGLLTIQTDRSLPPGPQWSRDRRVDPAAADQERRLREEAQQRGFDAGAFLAEMAHPWLCHQRLFDQMDAMLERIGREEDVYDKEAARDDAQMAAERMQRIHGICVDALGHWVEGERPSQRLWEDNEAAGILKGTYDALGATTPVRVWLASVLRKKIALFLEHDLANTLAV